MFNIVFVILSTFFVLTVFVIWYLLANRKSKTWRSQKTTKNKEKILALFQTKETVTNNDIEKLLGVSDATATRYLSELEREGKIVQIGKTGRGVEYRLK